MRLLLTFGIRMLERLRFLHKKGLQIAEITGVGAWYCYDGERTWQLLPQFKGDHASSLLFNNKALRLLYRRAGDTVSVGKIYNNMAITYADLGLEEGGHSVLWNNLRHIFEELMDYDMLEYHL